MSKRISILALQKARNFSGKPLDPAAKRRIELLVHNPSNKTWEDAHRTILNIDPLITLWKAVTCVDPSFPKSVSLKIGEPWPVIPSRETILAAINHAVQA